MKGDERRVPSEQSADQQPVSEHRPVRIRWSSALDKPCSCTRIGKRPCSSASRSEGLTEWKAPDAMNRIKSVFTLPCLVLMEQLNQHRHPISCTGCTQGCTYPSIRGNRSLCTPSALASAPCLFSELLQILSISSRKTTPSCSTSSVS